MFAFIMSALSILSQFGFHYSGTNVSYYESHNIYRYNGTYGEYDSYNNAWGDFEIYVNFPDADSGDIEDTVYNFGHFTYTFTCETYDADVRSYFSLYPDFEDVDNDNTLEFTGFTYKLEGTQSSIYIPRLYTIIYPVYGSGVQGEEVDFAGLSMSLPSAQERHLVFGTPYELVDVQSFRVSFELYSYDTYTIRLINSSGSYQDGYSDGYDVGFEDGEIAGVDNHRDEIFDDGYQEAISDWQQFWYDSGFHDGEIHGMEVANRDALIANQIFTGIISIALVPVNFFLGILNFDVFGINIGALVSSLLTVLVLVTIIKTIFGNKSGGTE